MGAMLFKAAAIRFKSIAPMGRSYNGCGGVRQMRMRNACRVRPYGTTRSIVSV
jgi:hypothetical protein